MHQSWSDLAIIIIEGMLALGAALAAVAFRRGTRFLTPSGFIMLALGLMLELMMPRKQPNDWVLYTRAAAIALIWCGFIRLVVESLEALMRRNRVHISTIATEFTLTLLYGSTILLVSWRILHFDVRQLLALPVLIALTRGWIENREMFSGLVIQSQKPFRPGDWVRFGNHVGRVQETGWRATRIRTRAQEDVTIPSDVLAHDVIINYSATACLADEIILAFDRSEPPAAVEAAILEALNDITEILKKPVAEITPWEFTDATIRYRIRYWLADYAHQEPVRLRFNRNLWYVMRRHQLGALNRTTVLDVISESHNGVHNGAGGGTRIFDQLRRVDLFRDLTDEELSIIAPSIKAIQYGRGETLIREGDPGDSFFILRHGIVDVIRESTNGGTPITVSRITDSSSKNFFGEIALLKGEPRNSTVRAHTDIEVLRIDGDGFAHLFRARPAIAAEIARIAAAREAETNAQASSVPMPISLIEQQGKLLQTMRRIFDF
jgi:CRP-like cAMP-binding protein